MEVRGRTSHPCRRARGDDSSGPQVGALHRNVLRSNLQGAAGNLRTDQAPSAHRSRAGQQGPGRMTGQGKSRQNEAIMQNLIPNFKSRTRKLVINNKTAWDTRQLRTVFLKVINENIKFEGPLQYGIRARVVYTRRGGYSGYAYFHSGRMTIRLPHPRRVKSDGS